MKASGQKFLNKTWGAKTSSAIMPVVSQEKQQICCFFAGSEAEGMKHVSKKCRSPSVSRLSSQYDSKNRNQDK